MKVLLAFLFTLFACSVALGQVPWPTKSPSPQQLRILPQTDARVQINLAQVTWATADQRGVQIYIQVENISEKPVRMYETRRDVDSPNGPKSCLGPGNIPGKLLRQGQKTGTSTWQGVFNSEPAPAVWVDFVEFADGTTWGADDCHAAEGLDGSRTGMRMQREQLLAMLHDKGVEALMEFIKANYKQMYDPMTYGPLLDAVAAGKIEKPVLPIWPTVGHSRNWELAFLSGAAVTLHEVRDAYWKWGADEIEHVLTRPIVATENKKH
ncbi:MAG TPA: hypothetical protein VKD91_03975 [Pyrinomonadaceae bacterium]|nr:hypothetical protein [Pyrinomonadaceae bacterium]